MSGRALRHLGDPPPSNTSRSPGRRDRATARSVVESRASATHEGVWDRDLDLVPPKVDPGPPFGAPLLDLVARLGFALFITAGFAAGLSLDAGTPLSDANLVRACEGVFFWSLALISCGAGRRLRQVARCPTGRGPRIGHGPTVAPPARRPSPGVIAAVWVRNAEAPRR